MGHKDVTCDLCGFTAATAGYNPNPSPPPGRIVVLVAMVDPDGDLITRAACAWNRRAGSACTVSNWTTWADRDRSPCLVATLTEAALLAPTVIRAPF